MNLLQIVVGFGCEELWQHVVVCRLFVSKRGKQINCNVSRDCMVTEGEFTMNYMWVFMASDAGEPSGDGDESAMVA